MVRIPDYPDPFQTGDDSFVPPPSDPILDRWFELLLVEPGLAECDRLAQRGGDDHARERLKRQLDRRCGWGARREELRNSDAWDDAVRYLDRQFGRANRKNRGRR